MEKLLYETADRTLAHDFLAREAKKNPAAECREDPSRPLPYQVWSGPAPRPDAPPTPPPPQVANPLAAVHFELTDEHLEKIAAAVAARLAPKRTAKRRK